MISRKFLIALKINPTPQYKIAQKANVNPTTLSQLLSGYLKPRDGDSRIVAVGHELGLRPDECFATTNGASDV